MTTLTSLTLQRVLRVGAPGLLFALALVVCSCSSDSETKPEEPEVPKDAGLWAPPEPNAKDYDWIRLKSGEWLKGDIQVLREDSLDFDSDKLDEQTFDWEDVVELRSPRQNSILFDDRTKLIGTVAMRDGIVRVREGDREYRFDRSRLSSIVPGEPTELNYWNGKISLGATLRSGNTNQAEVTFQTWLRRQTTSSRLEFNSVSSVGSVEGEQNVNNHNLQGQYDIFLPQDFYVTPVFCTYYRDVFQNISSRITPGAGVGHRIFHQPDLEWDISLGGAYQYTRFINVEAEQSPSTETVAAVVGTTFDMEITDDVDFRINYRLTAPIPEVRTYVQRLQVDLSVEITKLLDVDITFIWDRNGDPVPNTDGTVPQKDDLRLTVGFGLEF